MILPFVSRHYSLVEQGKERQDRGTDQGANKGKGS